MNEAHVDNLEVVEQDCLEDLIDYEDYFSSDYSDGLQESSEAAFTDETSVSVTNSKRPSRTYVARQCYQEVNADEIIDDWLSPAEIQGEYISFLEEEQFEVRLNEKV